MSSSVRHRLASVKPYLSFASDRTDAFILHLSRLLSTSQGIDASISTVLFAATLLHSQLTRVLSKRYEKLALALATKASASMLPGETVVASIEPPVSRLSQTCAGLGSLAEVTGEFWMFMRLWSLVHIYRRARETYSVPPRDAIIKTLIWGQVGASAVFQVIENVAYLASKGILRGGSLERRAPKWMAISNRFWMGEILLECLRLLRVRQMKYNEAYGAQEEEDSAEKPVQVQSEELRKRWQRDFYANAGWFPLTLHWSYEEDSNSPVTEAWQGICGLIPSVINIQDAWRQTS